MKQVIITIDDLRKYMGEDYYEFIDYLRKKNKIPQKEPIWIIVEWSEEK